MASRNGGVVLLVESHSDCCEMMAQYLRACGFKVITARTTDDGLSRAADADVIVTGINVRGSWDGIELIHRLRNADGTKQTPIIVLTACAFQADRQRAQAAGCNRFLTKPCLPDRVVSEIHAVLARRHMPKVADRSV